MSRSPEYQAYIVSEEWRRKSKRHQAWTRNHCALFPWCKSRHCHHLHYKNFKNELPSIKHGQGCPALYKYHQYYY